MTNDPKGGDGLRGPDKQQEGLRDERRGAYDSAGPARNADKGASQRTEHQRAQTGADVREGVGGDATGPADNFEVPEGLKRQRMGPYDRDKGRDQVPEHVPGPKDGTRGN